MPGHVAQVSVSLRLAAQLLAAHSVQAPLPIDVVEKPTGQNAQTVSDVAVHALATGRPLAQVEQGAHGVRPFADHVEPTTHGGATMHAPPEK